MILCCLSFYLSVCLSLNNKITPEVLDRFPGRREMGHWSDFKYATKREMSAAKVNFKPIRYSAV